MDSSDTFEDFLARLSEAGYKVEHVFRISSEGGRVIGIEIRIVGTYN